MTPIERVARAIYEQGMPGRIWADLGRRGQAHNITLARAALLALMDPTDEMVMVGLAESPDSSQRPNNLGEDMVACWQAMLQKALGE